MDGPALHAHLSRQLQRLSISPGAAPSLAKWAALLRVVSTCYTDADADRYLLERSIEVSSEEMRALNEVLSERATKDPLTGLPNRTALCAHLDDALHSRAARESDLAVIFIDLDGFKRVNDSLGHAAGDELLIQAADRIRGSVRSSDVVARLGGDEFVACCGSGSEPAAVAMIADRIVKQLRAPFWIDGQQVLIGASVGIAYSQPVDAGSDEYAGSEDLLSRADLAMYRAKTSGRSRYVVFDEGMGLEAKQRLSAERALHRALFDDEFVLHYQPIHDLRADAVIGMEALIRWDRPGHGLLAPDVFLPIAEKSPLIYRIDAWVMRRACLDAASWTDTARTVSVNVCSNDLQHEDFMATVSDALDSAGLAPHRLVIELTESTFVSPDRAVCANLDQIRALGVQLAIDDFGTGYSSLAYLRQLPSQTIKIDREFIRPIGADPVATAIVDAIIAMGHAVGQRVIAEGVETADQAQLLADMGCDAVQGYFFGRPAALVPPVSTLEPSEPPALTA